MDSHSHSHEGHAHHHLPPLFNNAFLISVLANGMFVVLQVIFSCIAHSTSLFADAMHNLGDVLSLIIAWIANDLLKRAPTLRSTYGMKKTSILAALTNGLLMVFTCGIIVSEAVYKLFSPNEVAAIPVMVVAAIGILVNGSTALLFLRGSQDLNIRGAYLHLMYDALISIGVVFSSVVLYFTGWMWIDPLVGLIIALVMLKGTWFLFKDSFRLIIDGVPRNVSVTKIREFLQNQPGVENVHDLHVWALSTQENALSVHFCMPNGSLSDTHRQDLILQLRAEHGIHHATIQVEQIPCQDACSLYS